ncbi:MAG: twin-arginine translocation signal domain-containing protein, partial [Candidatus Aminicenantes bacterium]|nr:twin-arginine translocation signal domain-containing protein [Candidatus Aminicenantes bacterium]
MGMTDKKPAADRISRRDFLRSSAAAGLGVALSGPAFGQSP